MGAISSFPFLIEAMGYNQGIYPDIDRIYKKDKELYYEAAKKHELYNSLIVTEGGLLQEEYCKKALGILLHIDNEDLQAELDNILHKGWPYAYLFAHNNNPIDLHQFFERAARKAGGLDTVSDDWINTQLFIVYFIALNLGKKVVNNEVLQILLEALTQRWMHYSGEGLIAAEDRGGTQELKHDIFAKYGRITNFNEMDTNLKELSDRVALLMDFDQLSFVSITEHIDFGEKEIEECLLAYLARTEKVAIEHAAEFLCSAIYIRYLAKAYKQVKKRYFENNKETMYMELAGLEKKLSAAKKEATRLSTLLSEATSKQMSMQKEIDRLQEELKTEKESRNELNGLREFIFQLEHQEVPDHDIDTKHLRNKKGVLIGGHERWQTKMKEHLPEFEFITADQKTFDTYLLRVPAVFVFPRYLSHAVYYRAMEAIKGTDTKVTYINHYNEQHALNQISQCFEDN